MRHATLTVATTPIDVADLLDRLWARTVITEDGCWLWTGGAKRGGYGGIRAGGKQWTIHRLAYEVLVGSFDLDAVIDHRPTCPKGCWNPDHLEPVTQLVNVSRGSAPYANPSLRPTCAHGHEYTEANTLWYSRHGKRPIRVCRECRRSYKRKTKARG